jgi:hypothetical protein
MQDEMNLSESVLFDIIDDRDWEVAYEFLHDNSIDDAFKKLSLFYIIKDDDYEDYDYPGSGLYSAEGSFAINLAISFRVPLEVFNKMLEFLSPQDLLKPDNNLGLPLSYACRTIPPQHDIIKRLIEYCGRDIVFYHKPIYGYRTAFYQMWEKFDPFGGLMQDFLYYGGDDYLVNLIGSRKKAHELAIDTKTDDEKTIQWKVREFYRILIPHFMKAFHLLLDVGGKEMIMKVNPLVHDNRVYTPIHCFSKRNTFYSYIDDAVKAMLGIGGKDLIMFCQSNLIEDMGEKIEDPVLPIIEHEYYSTNDTGRCTFSIHTENWKFLLLLVHYANDVFSYSDKFPLQMLIQSDYVPEKVLEMALKIHRRELSKRDDDGNLPLHCLLKKELRPSGKCFNNENFMDNEEIPEAAKDPKKYFNNDYLDKILDAYPDAAHVPDRHGDYPIVMIVKASLINRTPLWNYAISKLLPAPPHILERNENFMNLHVFPMIAVAFKQNALNKEQRLEDLSLLYQCIRSLPEFLITSI